MKPLARNAAMAISLFSALLIFLFAGSRSHAQNANFHDAPASAKAAKNPFQGQEPDAAKSVYQTRCAACHGPNGEGSGNIPSLTSGKAQGASDGELFWYITKGDLNNGMPAWDSLPEKDRWQIINYLRVLGGSKPGSPRVRLSADEAVSTGASAPPPKAPFTDYRYEKPGAKRKITLDDLPAPFATSSAGNSPQVVPRPENAWPQVPAGFKVELYASGLDEPRLIRTAPNGDFFVAESHSGEIRVFRGITSEGKPERAEVFATSLNRPFGINFYPPGPDPKWIYVGNTDSVVRFHYKNGDLKATAPPEHIAALPSGGGHWTRDIQFSPDGKKMFVSVGSVSNVDDHGHHARREKSRGRSRIQSRRLRNARVRVRHPQLRRSRGQRKNRRALVFRQRARRSRRQSRPRLHHARPGRRLLRLAVVVHGRPPGSAPRGQASRTQRSKSSRRTSSFIRTMHRCKLTFYDGKQFPAGYQGDIFAAEHGSWNKSARVGYELIRVPLASDRPRHRRVRRLHDRIRRGQRPRLGTSRRRHRRARRLASRNRRRLEIHLAHQLHGQVGRLSSAAL